VPEKGGHSPHRRITPAIGLQIAELHMAGKNPTEIAAELGFSREGIVKYMSRKKITPNRAVEDKPNRGQQPIPAETVQHLCELYRNGFGVCDIAYQLQISQPTVNKYLREAGLKKPPTSDAALDRMTKANKVNAEENKARRALLHDMFLDEAQHLLVRLHEPTAKVFAINAGGGKLLEHESDAPDPREARDLMQAAGTAMAQALKLADYDAESSAEAAKSLLNGLAEAFGVAADAIEGKSPEAVGSDDESEPELPKTVE
jgi:DNA-binding CsgD family transcriptional regulator